MGYTTYFEGQISVSPPLSYEERVFLATFSNVACSNYQPQQELVDALPDVQYPKNPGSWCDWVSNDDGTAIIWNKREKFYQSIDWMKYLIEHCLMPNPIAKQLYPDLYGFLQGHVLNGEIEAQGEDDSDHWKLIVRDNVVSYEVVEDDLPLIGKLEHNEDYERLAKYARELKQRFGLIGKAPITRLRLYEQVELERLRQDKQWGGPEHDDQHELPHWDEYIERQMQKARDVWAKEEDYTANYVGVRKRLVKIMALAAAAVESLDRKQGVSSDQYTQALWDKIIEMNS